MQDANIKRNAANRSLRRLIDRVINREIYLTLLSGERLSLSIAERERESTVVGAPQLALNSIATIIAEKMKSRPA